MINSTIGTTVKEGKESLNPSIEEVKVIAGVITPSASSAAPPIIVRRAAQEPLLLIRVKRAKIPPSPLLSDFSAISTYLTVAESVRVQKIHDNPP